MQIFPTFARRFHVDAISNKRKGIFEVRSAAADSASVKPLIFRATHRQPAHRRKTAAAARGCEGPSTQTERVNSRSSSARSITILCINLRCFSSRVCNNARIRTTEQAERRIMIPSQFQSPVLALAATAFVLAAATLSDAFSPALCRPSTSLPVRCFDLLLVSPIDTGCAGGTLFGFAREENGRAWNVTDAAKCCLLGSVMYPFLCELSLRLLRMVSI
jgi:hypothetical protein